MCFIYGTIIGLTKGNTRSLDYSSFTHPSAIRLRSKGEAQGRIFVAKSYGGTPSLNPKPKYTTEGISLIKNHEAPWEVRCFIALGS